MAYYEKKAFKQSVIYMLHGALCTPNNNNSTPTPEKQTFLFKAKNTYI